MWLAGRWAWSKWACTGAARWLALHGGRGRRAGAAQNIAEASTGGLKGAFYLLLCTIKYFV